VIVPFVDVVAAVRISEPVVRVLTHHLEVDVLGLIVVMDVLGGSFG